MGTALFTAEKGKYKIISGNNFATF